MSAKNTNFHFRVRMLCEGAMMVALAQVLSYIKLMELPNGGSLTPAMFPIILFAVRWGLTPGLMAGFTFGLLQLIFDGAYAWGWQSMLLDYLVAFTPLGLAGLFKGKKWGIFVGTVVGCLGRFVVHYISGVTIYKILAPTEFMKWTFTSPSAYSLVYNGSYMLPETIITVAGALLISLFLDFSSPSITRRRAKTEEALPRNNAALAAKLVGVVTVIGGILYSVSSVIYTFSASVQSGTEMELSSAAVTGTVVACAVAGVVLYALGEMVQLLSDIRENQLKNKKNNTQD